jgi:8-oxo-dGTP pyrophosphatase MutT (NUDIX family)
MKQAAGVGIIYKDLILLAKRVKTHNGVEIDYPGYWSIFCGLIEDGEGPPFCALRELKEETGISLTLPDIKYVMPILEENLTLHIYMTKLTKMPSVNLDPIEHSEFGWFKIEELDKFPYDICPHIVNIIKKFWKSKY